ncbi:flagellar biosynthetic protein FliR [bacterium]|nr:flagellar biosynthetic protein FliR [bacterium]
MDAGFLNLLSHVQGMDYNTLWKLLLLGFMRLAPICAIAPFMGAKLIPIMGRVGFALSLSVVFLPTILVTKGPNIEMASTLFVFYSLKELTIGFILGYLASIPFFVAQSSGIFIDYARGASSMMGQDPTTQSQASPIGIMMNYYLIVLFYALGGPLLFFDAISTSFEVVPVDGFFPHVFYAKDNHFWTTMLDILNQVFSMGVQLAAPSLVAILMAESFLGIANRLAPNVQIAFLGMPLKSLLGLSLLWAGWYVIAHKLGDYSIEWITALNKLVPFLQK